MSKLINRRDLFALLANLVTEQESQLDIDWTSEEVWGRLIPLAEMHKVTAGLPARLKDLGVWGQIPTDVAVFLDAVAELNKERNDGLARQCLTTLDRLQQADIEAMPLKGLAYNLMGLFDDEPEQRLTVDLDILVHPDKAESAQNVLIAQGYEAAREHDTDPRHHHNLPRLKPPAELQLPGSIEVHYRVGGDDVDALLPVPTVFETAETLEVSGRTVLVPNLLHLLDHAIMHSAISHGHARRLTLRLRDVIDIHRLWTAASAEGNSVFDLKIVGNRSASRYFGACLLIAGHPVESLGSLGPSSAKFLAQIMRRQSVAERAKLESSLLANAQLLFQNPSRLLSKFLRTSFYQAARSTFKSPNV